MGSVRMLDRKALSFNGSVIIKARMSGEFLPVLLGQGTGWITQVRSSAQIRIE